MKSSAAHIDTQTCNRRRRTGWLSLTGLRRYRQIRAVFPKAKFLVVTNHDNPRLRQAAEQLGACGYILKENLQEVRRRLQTQD